MKSPKQEGSDTYKHANTQRHLMMIIIISNICWGFRFPGNSASKESACRAGDPGSIPGLGRAPGEEIGYPPSSILERPW